MKKKLKNILLDSDFKEILTKGSSFLVFRLFGALVGYFFILYISNNYGADVYGLVALGFSIFLIVGVFGRLGLDINLVRFFSQNKNDTETGIFYKSIFISFLFSSFLALFLFLFKDIIVIKLYQDPKPELLTYLPWLLGAIPFWNISLICASYLRAKKNNNAFAFIENPSRFLFSLIIIVLVSYFTDAPPLSIVKAHFWGVIITALIGLTIVFKNLRNLKIKSSVTSIVFIKDSFPMLLSSSMLILLGLTDTQVMGIYETNSNIGVYNVCLKLATLTTLSLQAINSILAPKIAKSFANGDNDYKKLITFSTKLNFVITVIIVSIILFFNDFFLGLFGESFKAGAAILFIFCVGQIINSFSGSVGVILQMIGKQKIYQNFVVSALIINLILTFVLTPLYGGIGASISTVISMTFWNIGSAIYLKKEMNIESYYNFK